ncbi:hypothetical protein [Gemmatimonas sp.]|jgi:hypothetical protein|uniref:hypothetical protein n=1 Tax=Gemmatimonas sp. TaxID=1962908 RepID=UPI00334036E3
MERHNTLKLIDLSDLRLDAIEVLALPGTRGSAEFAASCGTNCNTRTACSCTQPKLVEASTL